MARSLRFERSNGVTQVINSQLPSQNELTEDSGYRYEYDALGNMTLRQSLSDPLDRTSYTWDARNLLIAVDGPINDVTYTYDAQNRRVAKTVNGITTQYVHDGLNIVLEYNGNGDLLARNTHAGLDQLCVRDEVGVSTDYYVCQDAISSVLAVTDDNGNVLQRYRYSAFGEQQVLTADFTLSTDTPLIPFAYTGREWEPEVGMYFYRARFYDAELGRFISRDPLGLGAGDVNFYAYVGNSGFNFTDPLGLISKEAAELARAYGNGAGGNVNPNAPQALSRGSSKAIGELERTARNAIENAKKKLADPKFKGNRKAQLNSIKVQANRLKAIRAAKAIRLGRFMRRGGFLLIPFLIPGDAQTWDSKDDDGDGFENGIDPYPDDFDNDPDNGDSNINTPKDSEH